MAPSLISSASCASAPVNGRLMPIVTDLSAAKTCPPRPAKAPTSAVVDRLIMMERRDGIFDLPVSQLFSRQANAVPKHMTQHQTETTRSSDTVQHSLRVTTATRHPGLRGSIAYLQRCCNTASPAYIFAAPIYLRQPISGLARPGSSG